MHIPWNDVQLVVAIAETGSLSGAARVLRLTQPTVSRRLADLEAELGEPLFVRAAAGATPTAFGERLLEPARRMAECAADVGQAADDADRTLRGPVRASAAPGTAHGFLAPFAAHLRGALPGVRLEVMSTTRYVDLVRREADLALRWQTPDRRDDQRDLDVVCEVAHDVAAFAAPSYAATLPARYTVRDVAWVAWCPPFDQLAPNPQLAAAIPGFQPAFASDDFLVQLRGAEAGAGAILLPRQHYRFAPPSPLVELKLALGVPPVRTQLVASRAALVIPRIRAVADLIAAELPGKRRR